MADPIQKSNRFIDFYNTMGDFFSDVTPARILAYQDFKVDIKGTDKEYKVEAELPGVKKDEIALKLDEGRLTIAVQREERTEEQKENYIHKERKFGKMERSFSLSGAMEVGIKAKFEDGVLHITVPKVEKNDKSLQIEIE